MRRCRSHGNGCKGEEVTASLRRPRSGLWMQEVVSSLGKTAIMIIPTFLMQGQIFGLAYGRAGDGVGENEIMSMVPLDCETESWRGGNPMLLPF